MLEMETTDTGIYLYQESVMMTYIRSRNSWEISDFFKTFFLWNVLQIILGGCSCSLSPLYLRYNN